MYNMFGLNFYFILKGIRLSGWETKLISIGGSNIDSQVKFKVHINIFKQVYQT